MKRSHSELQDVGEALRNVRHKPDPEQSSDSTIPSATILTANSTDAISAHNETDNTDLETDSELSVSSSEPSDLDSDSDSDASSESGFEFEDAESKIINLRSGTKPKIEISEEHGAPSILDKLREFMPKMKAANDELEVEREDGTLYRRNLEIVDEEEGGQIIEMVRGSNVSIFAGGTLIAVE
jgi:Domain of unknown function (DUF4598)